jgi:hypothetical protein
LKISLNSATNFPEIAAIFEAAKLDAISGIVNMS